MISIRPAHWPRGYVPTRPPVPTLFDTVTAEDWDDMTRMTIPALTLSLADALRTGRPIVAKALAEVIADKRAGAYTWPELR